MPNATLVALAIRGAFLWSLFENGEHYSTEHLQR